MVKFSKDLIRDYLNLANMLSVMRIILAPFFMIALFKNDYVAAFIILVAAALSDFFDGFVARKFEMQTDFGRILDPIADKVFVFFAVIALMIRFNFPLSLGVIIISRDVLILLGGIVFLCLGMKKSLTPNIFGKISTFMQLLALIVYVIASIFMYNSVWITIILYVMVFTTILSGTIYLIEAMKLFKERHARHKN